MEPLFNNIILKKLDDESEQQYGALVIPDMNKEKAFAAEVIAVGPGFWTVTGVMIETILKPGDKVLLPKLGAQVVNMKGEEYLIIRENDILTKI